MRKRKIRLCDLKANDEGVYIIKMQKEVDEDWKPFIDALNGQQEKTKCNE